MVKFGFHVWSDRPAKWILREKEAEKVRISSEEVTTYTTEFSPSLGTNSFFSVSFKEQETGNGKVYSVDSQILTSRLVGLACQIDFKGKGG